MCLGTSRASAALSNPKTPPAKAAWAGAASAFMAAVAARRVRIVVVPIELNNERAAMKDFSGSIRTSIQRQSGSQVAAA